MAQIPGAGGRAWFTTRSGVSYGGGPGEVYLHAGPGRFDYLSNLKSAILAGMTDARRPIDWRRR